MKKCFIQSIPFGVGGLLVFVVTAVLAQNSSDPCATNILLDEVAHNTSFEDGIPCRGGTVQGHWYRFEADDTGEIATNCPSGNQCGSGTRIWINGSLPDSSDGVISLKGCMARTSSCCSRSQAVSVKYCSGYFVYNVGFIPSCASVCLNTTATSATNPTTASTTSYTTPSITTTTTSSPTLPTTTTPSTTTTTLTTTTSPSISTTLGRDPCLAYNNLTDGFTMVDETDQQNESIMFFPPGWYRMPYTLTGTLSTSCPQGNQCGSGDIIWSNETNVTNTETIVTIQLCLKTSRNCCERPLSSRQKRCEGFLIYDLPPTMPRTRLCYNNTESSTSTSTSTLTTTTSTTATTTTTTPTTTASTTPTTTTSSPSPATPVTSNTASITTAGSHDDQSASTFSTTGIAAICASGVIVVGFIIAILIIQRVRKSDSVPVTKERDVFRGVDNNTYGMTARDRVLQNMVD